MTWCSSMTFTRQTPFTKTQSSRPSQGRSLLCRYQRFDASKRHSTNRIASIASLFEGSLGTEYVMFKRLVNFNSNLASLIWIWTRIVSVQSSCKWSISLPFSHWLYGENFRSIIPITHAAIRTVGMISDTHGLEAFFCGNVALPMIHIAVTPITHLK